MEIAIIGAGVAGLSAAFFLSRGGHAVRVFDHLEKPAPVGSGLVIQPTGQAILGQMGLKDKLISKGARINRLYGRSQPSGSVVLDVRMSALGEDVFGVGVHRALLFDLLFNAAEAMDIAFEFGVNICSVDALSGGRLAVVDDKGRSHTSFDLVVDASGAGSGLHDGDRRMLGYGALWANLPWSESDGFDPHALEQRYFRASKMVGVLPIGEITKGDDPLAAFFWSLRRRDYEAWRNGGLGAWREEVTSLWPETAPMVDHIKSVDQLIFAQYSHHRLPSPTRGRVVHIGDSWHSASPQLGQGANMALLDAYALSLALNDAGDVEVGFKNFLVLRALPIRLYQMCSYLFTPVYQSDSRFLPWLRDIIAAPISRVPPAPKLLAALVAGMFGTPLTRLGL